MSDHGISSWGASPYLQRLMEYSWQRNQLLQDAAANLDTPGFRPKDVPVEEFQSAMKAARARETGVGTPVVRGQGIFADTDRLSFETGRTVLKPEAVHDNLLFHDDNDRNLERIMQNLAENALSFRLASELFRKEHDLLRAAIRERP